VIGRSTAVDITLLDAGISRRHARIEQADGGLLIRDLDSQNGTWVDEQRVTQTEPLPPTCRVRLGTTTVVQITSLDEMGLRAHRKLRQTLLLDPLTGTGKRGFLELRLREEVSYSHRHAAPLAVMMVDVDDFKAINDRYGHANGDLVLAHVGLTLRKVLRVEDSVFRYGGDEFCVLVRNADVRGIEAMARRLRQMLSDTTLLAGDQEFGVRVSIGAAGTRRVAEPSLADATDDGDDELVEYDLVSRADRALYTAKRAGRDRVHVDWN